MASAFITSCRRCLQLSRYRTIVNEGCMGIFSNFHARNARTNLRKVQHINPLLTNNDGEVLEKSATNSFNTVTALSSKNEVEMISVNHSSENFDVDRMPPYIKLQDDDNIISKAMVSVNSKKNRMSRTEILLEGNRLISEAIKFGVDPKVVFFSRVEDAKKICWPEVDFRMYKVSYRTIKIWSSLKTSPGVIGIFKKPDIDSKDVSENSMPLLIVCDNIRDPGNLGSILRVAAGVGCQRVFLTKGCVDLWEPKVLRSGAGAHFVMPVRQGCTWEEIEKSMDDESTVILADNYSSSSDGSINDIVTQSQNDLPLKQYHMVDYSGAWEENSPIVLVLGGETEGLSEEACKLAESRDGVRLHIPLCNEVESLNASTALGVITFEIRRQYDEWTKKMVLMSLPNKNSS